MHSPTAKSAVESAAPVQVDVDPPRHLMDQPEAGRPERQERRRVGMEERRVVALQRDLPVPDRVPHADGAEQVVQRGNRPLVERLTQPSIAMTPAVTMRESAKTSSGIAVGRPHAPWKRGAMRRRVGAARPGVP